MKKFNPLLKQHTKTTTIISDDVLNVCYKLLHIKIQDFGVNQVEVLRTPEMEKEEWHHVAITVETPNVSMVHVFFPSSVTFVFYMSQ